MKTQAPSFKTCSPRVEPQDGFALVLDAGTTGIKAFVFDGRCRVLASAYRAIAKTRPRRGWVEQDPAEILKASVAVLRDAVKRSNVSPSSIRGMGITNQREATVLWDRKTGTPVYPVIGWEDARTKRVCRSVPTHAAKRIREATGLPVDPYFSASKIGWILDHVPGARERANEGRLAFGTVDAWLIWNLCENRPHLTDETNAARTLLYDIRTRRWDTSLAELFHVPSSVLPSVHPSRAYFGSLDKTILGRSVPLVAVCGDQQASTYAAIRSSPPRAPNPTKVTYGTGTFVAQVSGRTFPSHASFVTTLVPDRRGTSFALESKIEGSGETVARLLERPARLRAYLKKLAGKVDDSLRRLPKRPKQVIADGGIARDGIVVELQERISGIPTYLQSPYGGTALGAALLVWDALKNDQKTPDRSHHPPKSKTRTR